MDNQLDATITVY